MKLSCDRLLQLFYSHRRSNTNLHHPDLGVMGEAWHDNKHELAALIFGRWVYSLYWYNWGQNENINTKYHLTSSYILRTSCSSSMHIFLKKEKNILSYYMIYIPVSRSKRSVVLYGKLNIIMEWVFFYFLLLRC